MKQILIKYSLLLMIMIIFLTGCKLVTNKTPEGQDVEDNPVMNNSQEESNLDSGESENDKIEDTSLDINDEENNVENNDESKEENGAEKWDKSDNQEEGFDQENPRLNDELLEISKQFVKDVLTNQFDNLVQNYSYEETMLEELMKATFQAQIQMLNASYGEIIELKEPYTVESGDYILVYVPVELTLNNCNVLIYFDENQCISGIYYNDYQDGIEEAIIPEGVDEIQMDLVHGEYTLSGILTLPEEVESFPVVVLVHGSGPCDMDETVVQNKPFRDLAWGLAQQGIGTYRYDKRSFIYGEQLDLNIKHTLYDETVEDAVAAVNMLKNLDIDEININGIYIVGHSLGGYAIPLIAQILEENAQGYIMLAAPAENPVNDLMRQNKYLVELDNMVTKEEEEYLEQVKEWAHLATNPETMEDNQTSFGLYKEYWLYMKAYQTLKFAKQIKQPVLVLQGEKDYQVTMKQFEVWKQTFEENILWQFISYPELNHLMMINEGEIGPSAYDVAGRVDDRVINDIATFILSNELYEEEEVKE